tara:strand:- start:235 stop:954 length:720 start_codon:yes stop_codon:yes gene_type:complete
MQKSKLDKFISKYNLGGNVNSVKWKSTTDSLSTTFVTPDKSLLGNVKVDNFQFENAELGVYQTDQLKSLIGVLGDDISIELSKFDNKAVSLKVKNGSVSVDYVLSDLSVIADPPELKKLPEFETRIKVDNNFINTFIKGKNALSDVDTFTILNGKNGLEVVIGYSSTNTNRVNIPVDVESSNLDNAISFNANLFKEVLIANKECTSAILEVSNGGLARLNFKIDDYDSTYYVVAIQDVD